MLPDTLHTQQLNDVANPPTENESGLEEAKKIELIAKLRECDVPILASDIACG